MIVIDVVGTEFLAARFKTEVRAFQKEQAVMMRKAAKVVQADVVLRVARTFKSVGQQHTDFRGTKLGPLVKSIGFRVFRTTSNVIALVRPRARAFYGRFHETGISKTATRKEARTVYFGGGFKRLKAGSYTLTIPRRPFLEPAVAANSAKVGDILGESYGVFYRGGA
jgi:hypothetical protein